MHAGPPGKSAASGSNCDLLSAGRSGLARPVRFSFGSEFAPRVTRLCGANILRQRPGGSNASIATPPRPGHYPPGGPFQAPGRTGSMTVLVVALESGQSRTETWEGAMKGLLRTAAALMLGTAAGVAAAQAADAPPGWAYGFTTPPP